MVNIVNYIIESGVSLALLTAIYVLFLRKETFFRQNRIFLQVSILFSILLPFVKIPLTTVSQKPVMLSEVTVFANSKVLEAINIYSHEVSDGIGRIIQTSEIIAVLYFIGMLFFFFRLVLRIGKIVRLIQSNRVEEKNGYKIVFINGEFSPFSFLNYIFISNSMAENESSDRMILHELEHVKQGHTFDILLLEILSVFQWFNPFLWLLKRIVRENHEFLADRAVISKGVSVGTYKQLLLNQVVGQQYLIANSFNYSLIKKRIMMMSKIKSSKIAGIKYVLGFVIAVALIIGFGCEMNTNISNNKSAESVLKSAKDSLNIKKKYGAVFFIVEKMPEYPGGEKALHKYIAQNVRYPVEAQEKRIQGRVYVSFIVNKTGNIDSVKLARGVDPLLNEEAMRVIREMPQWKPGIQRGVPVNVRFTVPINFMLNENIVSTKSRHDSINGEPVFSSVQKMPEFPGGKEAMHKYISESIKYPKVAKENGIVGKVYVSFVIDKKGKVINVKLARGIDPVLDEEALRVIKDMPTWKPGKQNGKNVYVRYFVPVNFELK